MSARTSRLAWGVAGVAVLAGLICLLHGRCLGYGLFMDDYAHFRQLRACDWSLAGLAGACRLELIGGVVELWWLPEVTLRFFRPVAFGLMKLTYELSGWNPWVQHATSLAWHGAVCLLLVTLLRRLATPRWIAWSTAALFAIHPGHVGTVQWIACQSELMVTAFLLGATLCWGRFRAWPGFADDSGRRREWGLGAVACFAAALGCRENAIMFPVLVGALELRGENDRRRLLLTGAALVAVAAAYLAVRHVTLGGGSVPPRPYVVPPTAPDFGRFVVDKALYTLLGEYFLIPSVPIGGLAYFQARSLLFYGLATPLVAALVAFCWWQRRRPLGWLGPLWLILFMLPVLPVFTSPHHLYLPGVGWAVTIAFVVRGVAMVGRRRVWRGVAAAIVVGSGGLFAAACYYFGLVFDTGQAVEDRVVAELAAAPSGLHDGDTLYIANLPMVAHYAQLAVEEQTGKKGLRVVPLTWAQRLLGPATPAELTWVDDRTIEIHITEDAYFSDALGLLVREATAHNIPDKIDRRADLGLRVRVLERAADGVAALRFEFDRPPHEGPYHLFWGSRARWACEVRP